MLKVKCPQCSVHLKLDETLTGRRVRCPKCRKILRVPEIPPEEPEIDETFPAWLAVLCGFGLLTLAGFLLAIAVGPTSSFVLCTLLGVLALGIWQRQRLLAWLAARLQQMASPKPTADTAVSTTTGLASPPRLADEQEPHLSSEGLTEIQPAFDARPRVSNLGRGRSSIDHVTRWLTGPKLDDVRFYGTGSYATVAGEILKAPLIYLVEGQLRDTFDASLIETGLPVAKSSSGALDLPYWSSYRGCSPQQRRQYLDWLISGRSQPQTELGYVFIYFYGLERRLILDRTDHEPIVRELLRLISIYSQSRSFQRYAATLIWTALLSAPDVESWSDELINHVIDATAYWNEDHIAAMLAVYHCRNESLPARAAYIVGQHDPRSPRSVVIRRHEDRFRELFTKRYHERFGDGIVLRTAKRDRRMQYRPASESLMYVDEIGSNIEVTFPNVPGISSQFKPLVEIWSSAIDDLRAFDRAHKKSDGESMTAAMYESLPPELRQSDHPDFDAWYDVMNRFTDDAKWTLVPVGDLASIRGIVERKRLTKKQSEDLLNVADCMELCIEPDVRETGQSYRWDEFVSIFPREHDGAENLKSYHASSILLRLGMTIAAADGAVDSDELATITDHLEKQFQLSPQESVRLEHLAYVLSRTPGDEAKLGKKLQDLPETQRVTIGEFLVGVAAADEIVTKDEVKALKKVFRNLGLAEERLELLVAGHITTDDSEADAEDELVLNHDRIREIMTETAQVANFLQRVMLDDGDTPEPSNRQILPSGSSAEFSTSVRSTHADFNAKPNSVTTIEVDDPSKSQFDGLDTRYCGLLLRLLTQSEWDRAELEATARSQNLMLSGAIEAINEWSLESYGDWLIDDSNDPLCVSRELIK